MFNRICFLFLLFMIYSFLGWLMEVILQFLEKKRFINRGFLIGPYCPIYGWGSITIILLLYKYKEDFVTLFCMAIVICSLLEYGTSFVMEKLFHTRWWDYSYKKFNINGRICLDTMLPFGILGCIVLYVINPFFTNILNNFSSLGLNIVAIILFVLYLVDNIISFNVIFKIRKTICNVEKDATEEITRKVKNILTKQGILYRRMVNAFPTIKNTKEYLINLRKKIDNDLKKFKDR